MKLKIISIENKGDLTREVVWLEVLEACNLQYYKISDTTYTSENSISNEVRHTYWFPTKQAARGDLVALRTKAGTNTTVENERKTKTHIYYWNLGRTIWNKDGDCAVLFELTSWKATRA